MRKGFRALVAASLLLLPAAAAAHAQGTNLTGSWAIQMTAAVAPRTAAPVTTSCSFQGTANVAQTGSQLIGDMSVDLTSGALPCPPTMSASMSGNVTGNLVSMGVAMGGGTLGQASFAGTSSAVASAAKQAGGVSTMSGTFSVTSGPFTGTSGTWSAAFVPALAAVPALGGKGLVVLALLLAGTALWFWRRPVLRRR